MISRQIGFTLVEILVVLTLLSAIVGLLAQSFSVFYKAYLQTDALESDIVREELVSHWFRDNISGAIPSKDPSFRFTGDNRKITFTSVDSLKGPQGKIKRTSWIISMEGESSTLLYEENNEQPIPLMVWQNRKAGFYFRDESTDWIKFWPPEESKAGMLPRRVKLKIQGDAESEIFVAINTRRTPRYDYRDLL